MSLSPGAVVAGRFEVVATLADDEAEATERGSDRRVWLARVPDARAAKRALKRARRAAAADAGLGAPRELVADGATTYWVGEWPGEAQPVSLDDEAALDLARELGRTLAMAHALGVFHGRLALRHVRRVHGRVVVVGLGALAARRDDERSDVEGFGRALYHALAGAPPFDVPAETLPPRFRPTVLRCLQRDPERRYGSIGEVLAALGLGLDAARVQPPRARGLRLAAAALVLGGAAAGVAVWRPWQKVAPVAAGVAADAGASDAAAPEAYRPVVAVVPFSHEGVAAEQAWTARALEEIVAQRLDDVPGLEVTRARLPREGLVAAARKANIDLIVQGGVEPGGAAGGLRLEVRLFDVRGEALRLAERGEIAAVAELPGKGLELAAVLRKGAEPAGPGGAPAPGGAPQPGETTSSPVALAAYAQALVALEQGDDAAAEEALGDAIAADGAFAPPRVALVELYAGQGRDGDAARAADAARATVAPAGEPWTLRLEAAAAPDLDGRIAALEGLRARSPRDGGVAAALTTAYRRAGRADACVSEGQRALAADPGRAAVHRDLAWCRLLAGDMPAAAEAARAWSESGGGAPAWELVGDLALARGKAGTAREAYRKAVDAGGRAAAAKLPLVELVVYGRCLNAVQQVRQLLPKLADDRAAAETVAWVWARASLACGDAGWAREAVAWLKKRSPAAGEALEVEVDALRGAKGAYARALARAQDGGLWAEGAIERGRRWLPVLAAAARADGTVAAEALAALGPASPLDRFAPIGAPLAYDRAIAQLAAGDSEGAAQSCKELRAAAPDWALGHYCEGRVLEAQEQWSAAFTAYRAFLDRWVDADEQHRLKVDVKRRLPRVIAKAREPKPAPSPAPPPAPPAP